ncbi:4-diphosphocytidyl-2-C-methyl-D-erythritol kinase [Lachnospiraceae bacterium XBB2008]|nr:4-diphosphocytidyl-2-C-methyl-D-erythritol kinase [Lachnospiraceae bacterium XBB2008]
MYTKYNPIHSLRMTTQATLMNNMSANSITETAYAKINLALDITGRLPNGYHAVRMVMETISIHDALTFTLSDKPGIRLTCQMEDDALSVSELDCGDDNLIVRAACALLSDAEKSSRLGVETAGSNRFEADKKENEKIGLDIALVKRIPMAAGMAGGSSDAAATLRGVNKLLNLGYTDEELCITGVTIGADVPYCILGGSMLAEGIGEKLTPIPAPPDTYILIAKPDIDVSTAYVYRQIDSSPSIDHPDVDGMISAIKEKDLSRMASKLGNVLRDVTAQEYAIVPELEQSMRSQGAKGALMSGSGPTVFGLFDNKETCMQALDHIRALYPDIYVSDAVFVSNKQ